MAHVYEARSSNGKTYEVTTDEHHSSHSDDSFKRHLWEVITGSIAGVVSGSIVHFLYKGRK